MGSLVRRGAILSLTATLLAACGDDDVASPDAGGVMPDASGRDSGGRDAAGVDAALPDPDWQTAYCTTHECWFVMQAVTGASDTVCNGRHPTDLGTTDASGKRNCPFATLTGPIRNVLNPETGPANSKTIFVGGGTYNVAPVGLNVRGDGANASEAVVFTTWRGEDVTIDGTCPASCTVDLPSGPVTLTPCCSRECPSCTASPLCVPNMFVSSGCAIPIPHVNQLMTTEGTWVRIEGFRMLGCFEDNLRVSVVPVGEPPTLVPNRHMYIANNAIEGCELNENIKGLRQGPGPLDGGPVWGPVHIIGNEFFSMASQAVDATGVHAWLIEESYLHDAKIGSNIYISFDGGGIGFKNGSSDSIVRNNWSSNGGGGFGMGGGSGSCISDMFGCYQRWEMRSAIVENNVAIDPGASAPTDARRGLHVFQCEDCLFAGNMIELDDGLGLIISDECPGPRCSSHNPMLQPTRDLRFERNFIRGRTMLPSGAPIMTMYHRDVHPTGPAANGMTSRDNVFCAASGFPVAASPDAESLQFGHRDPGMAYALASYRAQIGDMGSAIFNAAGAASAPCPAGPAACTVGVDASGATWSGPPACTDCACTLVLDQMETPVACDGAMALPAASSTPGRHYVSLRVNRAGGGTSCGASYGFATPVVGAGCTILVDAGGRASWSSTGVQCRLLADSGMDLGAVPCAGGMDLPASLMAVGRHHLRLAVRDAPDGQTTCGTMFNR